MNITVLTNKNSLYGKKVIFALAQSGVTFSIVVINQPLSFKFKLLKSVVRRIGWFEAFKITLKRIKDNKNEYNKIKKEKPELLKDYAKFCKDVVFSDGTNSLATERALKQFKTDLLILGQAGILRQNILKFPKIGTLNGHPGVLPFYRGIDCPHWAIFNRDFDKIGASVHWVEQGIDTGKIIATEKFPVKGMSDISILEACLYTLCSEMIAKVVIKINNGDYPNGTIQLINEGQQYYKMSYKQLKSSEAILQGL